LLPIVLFRCAVAIFAGSLLGCAGGGDVDRGTQGTGGTGRGGRFSGAAGTGLAGTVGHGGSIGAGGSAAGSDGSGAGGTAGSGIDGAAGTSSACGEEDCGSSCTIPTLPAMSALTSNAKLPDPFMMMAGTRITSKSEWQCRRAEIAAQLINYETGPKDPRPPGEVTGSFAGNKLTVNVLGESFTVNVMLPSGEGPFPAVVYLDGSQLASTISGLGVASIAFDTNGIANQNGMRGSGSFYSITGGTGSSGALIGWAWGVSRIIDALEVTPAAKIDPKRIGVTGCSRNGKGALVVGAFDERIALTIPQESGSGGTASWRVSYAEDASFGGTMSNHKVQTLDSAYGEQPWFGTALQPFGTSANANKLPFDHHQLLGMVAPRGLLILENTNYQWLGVNSVANAAAAGRKIFEALGVPDNIGFSNSGHTHCGTIDGTETAYLNAFVRRFLLDQTVDTKAWRVSKAAFSGSNATVDEAKWIDWTTPRLN
jgi:hypothetical protein